ncbi:MAG TPA: IS481 family transposase [Solirubrobacterales bacterium]|nr:IS481 family transposase [Solirubrobacterales bacterium]
MKLHANAPLGPKGRAIMVRRVLEEREDRRQTVGRYRAEGEAGLLDRSSAPRHVHNTTPPDRVEAIAALRRVRLTGPEIAETLGMATSTVSAVLKRIGLGKLSRLERPEPIRRYERQRPGELIHIDVKKLGRIGPHGAYAEVLPDELLTDNGPAYRSTAHSLACRAMGIKHIRTRPYRPQTNGKAERFIPTMLREWAYAAIYGSSPERAAALSGWLERYNFRRRHGALGHRPPIQRLRELTGNNVAGIYS